MKKRLMFLFSQLTILLLLAGCGQSREKVEGNYKYTINKMGGVTIVEYHPFDKVVSVEVPHTLGGRPVTVIGDGSFAYSDIKEISIPETVKIIDDFAFQQCQNLETVNLSANIKKIGRSAFRECSALKAIHFPDSLETIEAAAFKDATQLLIITGGKNLQSIESDSAFANTAWEAEQDFILSLCGIVFGTKSAHQGPLTLPEGTRIVMKDVFERAADISELFIPASVTYLGDSCFSSMPDLRRVTFADGAELQLGFALFRGCPSLEYADLGNITNVPDQMFQSCENLTSVTANRVTYIGESSFSDCSSLHTFDFSNIKSIGCAAFSRSGLMQVMLPEDVRLEDCVFFNCSSLVSASIACDVPANTFIYCDGLAHVTLENGCHTVGPRAFDTNQTITVDVSSTVSRIAPNAFGRIGHESPFVLTGSSENCYAKIYAHNHSRYFTINNTLEGR